MTCGRALRRERWRSSISQSSICEAAPYPGWRHWPAGSIPPAARSPPATFLELERTEGVAIFESAKAREALQNLKGLGVRLSIDDFGTGYSALGRLPSPPFDRLKVDKVFVED